MSPTPPAVAPAPGDLRPAPAPAPLAARVLTQAAADLRGYLRNGEQLLLTMVLPALILLGLAHTDVPDLGVDAAHRLDAAVAGVLALAVVSTAFTGQAIGTGFDRRYRVLRLLAATPLGRDGLLGGRLLAVLAVEAIQVALLTTVAVAVGWRPDATGLLPGLVGLLLGTAAFVSLGLLLAGTLRAEAVLAVANLVWVLVVTLGGLLVVPGDQGPWGGLVRLLPSGALGEVARTAVLDGTLAWTSCLVLIGWTVVGGWAVNRWFRWE